MTGIEPDEHGDSVLEPADQPHPGLYPFVTPTDRPYRIYELDTCVVVAAMPR